MFCTQCGAPLVEDASFCGNCGWRRSTAQDIRAEVEAREARGLKLCVKCRSEIPIDATVCHRCDAPQPGAESFGGPAFPPASTVSQPVAPPLSTAVSTPALASIGRRAGAYIIDVLVLVVLSVIAIFALGIDPEDEGSQDQQLLIYVGLTLAYFIIAEALTGQTAGKRLTGIRVVTEEGEPISWGKSVGRNLLRIVDSLPALYIVGIFLMLRSEKLQRCGDRAARTIVIMDGR
jgi:uncharacterized RDD family membrane protein YckC/ribosomal protein L40E